MKQCVAPESSKAFIGIFETVIVRRKESEMSERIALNLAT